MKNDALLFLDFDGVLCDSLSETLVSSWVAYHRFVRREIPQAISVDFKTRFSAFRPFVRTGEDYIILQDIIFKGLPVASQADFDRFKDQAGTEKMSQYREMFYSARRELLAHDRPFWLSLNPVFPALKSALMKKQRHPRIYILSTKKKEFILEILSAQGIIFVDENVIDSGNESKLRIISKILDMTASKRARFIDDQIDHLNNPNDSRINVFLADWGYIKPEWLNDTSSIPVISIEKAAELIEKTESMNQPISG